ncbi:MAG: hypothetical protein WAR24_10465 [Candidatus Acidiferrales bacterium]
MSAQDARPASNRLREGYQPVGSVERGYQPNVQMTINLQPPPVGSTAVVPSNNVNGNPVPASTPKQRNQ